MEVEPLHIVSVFVACAPPECAASSRHYTRAAHSTVRGRAVRFCQHISRSAPPPLSQGVGLNAAHTNRSIDPSPLCAKHPLSADYALEGFRV